MRHRVSPPFLLVFSAPASLAALFLAGCTGQVGTPDPGPEIPGVGDTASPLCKGTLTPSPTRVVRLNDLQISKAITTLLPGVTVPPIHTPGRPEHEFVSWADQFPVQDAFAVQLSDATFNVAAQIGKTPALAVSCAAGQAEADCARTFVDRFVTQAFRRPLTADERTEMMAVYQAGVTNGAGFSSGIELVVAATLNAPSFLYRTELGAGDSAQRPGQPLPLSPLETASWLSFTLQNTLPDAELFRVALDGTLAQRAVLEHQVDRLLALPATHETLTQVLLDWADVPDVTTVEKTDHDLSGRTFDASLRTSLLDEARRFVGDVLWNGGTFSDLLTSPRAFIDSRAATHYGVADPGSATMATTLPAGRSGLLSRAGFIAATRYGDNPEVFRGRLLRERFLCGKLAEPPATVDTTAFNAQYAGLSTRQRIAVRAKESSCSACHGLMDNLGIAFDGFGALGQPVASVNGVPPDPAGVLSGTDVDGPFADLTALSVRLGGSTHALSCAVEQMMTYAAGREMDLAQGSADACAHAGITAAVTGGQGKLAQVFRALALSPVFSTRLAGGQP